MPTTRPRYQVTETPSVAHVLDVAERIWPGEPRSRLLRRVIEAGGAALAQGEGGSVRDRIAAVEATSGKFSEAFPDGYLADLRRDWAR